LKSMAETVSQQKPHWVDVTIEDTWPQHIDRHRT
jgi:hypothetical protein